MAMDPNKNSQNPPVTPGDSSRTVHLSPPLPGGHTILGGDFELFTRGDFDFIRKRLLEEINRADSEIPKSTVENFRCADLGNVLRKSGKMILELPEEMSYPINISPAEWLEEMSSRRPRRLSNIKIPSQNQFINKIPFTESLPANDNFIQNRSFFDNSPPLRVLPDPPRYGLQFINKVRNPSFTTNLVRDDNGHAIQVAIYDKYTQSIISPDDFLSSAKVSLIVLNAEFVETKGETLSRDVFNQSVLRERERKGTILTGHSRIIQLENGVGTFESIVFNDNSSWTKNGFRLGVTIMSDGEEGYFNGERVLEGVSEPFRVKDRRVKASEKPVRLKLTHSVRCIKKIGKDRASSLQKENINKVENFLELFYNNPSELRKILCIKSETSKDWDSMIEHVMQCANEYNALNNNSQPRQALVHPIMESNMPLSTNGERLVVGSGSSEPNPSENDIIDDYLHFYMSS